MDMRSSHPIIDQVLDRHRGELGPDLFRLRNHIYRGFNYHLLLLGDDAKLGSASVDGAALAWAVHDIGIWTAGAFDYLELSAALARELAAEFGIADVDGVQDMIVQHHRLRPVHDRMTETFRRADLIDVSRGLLRGPVGRSAIRTVVAKFPYLGFHRFLAHGLISYSIRHPTHPLPMLRW